MGDLQCWQITNKSLCGLRKCFWNMTTKECRSDISCQDMRNRRGCKKQSAPGAECWWNNRTKQCFFKNARKSCSLFDDWKWGCTKKNTAGEGGSSKKGCVYNKNDGRCTYWAST